MKKVKARVNFKLNLLIKVTNFEPICDYRLGLYGRPRLASQTAYSKGSIFGFGGGETNEVVYAYRRFGSATRAFHRRIGCENGKLPN